MFNDKKAYRSNNLKDYLVEYFPFILLGGMVLYLHFDNKKNK